MTFSQRFAAQVTEPASRCLLATLLLVCTGPLLISLVQITVSDLVALIVVLVRLLANSLPCCSLLLLLHDALAKQTLLFGSQTPLGAAQSNDQDPGVVLYLRLLIATSIVLYSCDLFVYALTSSDFHQNYRSLSFNVQVLLAALYLIKPWRWGRLDLRDIAAGLERFYRLALKTTRAVVGLLNNLPRRQRPQPNSSGLSQSESGSSSHQYD